MILSCQGICKSFGDKVILKDASFHIEEREKAALVGSNGAVRLPFSVLSCMNSLRIPEA